MASITRTLEARPRVVREDKSYIETLNGEIVRLLRRALPLTLRDPGLFSFLVKSVINQLDDAVLRAARANEGMQVPAMMIASVTHNCYLRFQGCYERAPRV